MREDYKHIEDLLGRFFEGMTSDAEERELYAFFTVDPIPPHLLEYKALFEYFESGLEGELRSLDEIAIMATPKRKPFRRPLWAAAGIAVSAVVLLAVFLTHGGRDNFDPFEGSYIVRNGVRVTDTRLIRLELEAIMQQVLTEQERNERIELEALIQIREVERIMREQETEFLRIDGEIEAAMKDMAAAFSESTTN